MLDVKRRTILFSFFCYVCYIKNRFYILLLAVVLSSVIFILMVLFNFCLSYSKVTLHLIFAIILYFFFRLIVSVVKNWKTIENKFWVYNTIIFYVSIIYLFVLYNFISYLYYS